MRPYPGETVGLQLDTNLKLIGFDLIQTSLCLLNLGKDSQQVLHMMADLVGDHVGLRELTASASDVAATEAPLEILEEGGIEIDSLVVRTVERAHGGLGETTCRARGA